MANKYVVHVDVTFSGTLEVEANSAKEAREIIRNRSLTPEDISYFYFLKNKVVDVTKF